MSNTVYRVETWFVDRPEQKFDGRPYETIGAARGRLKRLLNQSNYGGQAPYLAGRVLELTGEWKEVA